LGTYVLEVLDGLFELVLFGQDFAYELMCFDAYFIKGQLGFILGKVFVVDFDGLFVMFL
jgi:hypothetical protein